jgi:aspartate carbamoyltransferase regulatory subunit
MAAKKQPSNYVGPMSHFKECVNEKDHSKTTGVSSWGSAHGKAAQSKLIKDGFHDQKCTAKIEKKVERKLALPPGYEDELHCPKNYCLADKPQPAGFAGPRASFHKCVHGNKTAPVEAWGSKKGEAHKKNLKNNGYVLAEKCKRRLALPPGYEDELHCPKGFCLANKKGNIPPGPRTSFHECKKGKLTKPVESWGSKKGHEAKKNLKNNGYVLAHKCKRRLALPPGYDEELHCPKGFCLADRKRGRGFAGPRTAFHKCMHGKEEKPVMAWGKKKGESHKANLKNNGYVLAQKCPKEKRRLALPPGYEDELHCPQHYCLTDKKQPAGFAGPRSMFHECKKGTEIKPVKAWGK